MALQRTLSIIKPDGVAGHHIGDIVKKFETNGLKVAAMKMTYLSSQNAGEFYAVHKSRPFYQELVQYMTSGPVVIMVLEGDDAVQKNRDLMGATDPKKADKGTIRAEFGKDIGTNTVHGSDSLENAKTEIAHFFANSEIF